MSEPKKEWYVVNTYAGHENRVKENLERRIETMGLQDFLFQIVVAEEKEIEYKNGKEVEKTKNLFSGYLFVQMIMTDEAWYIVRNTPGVTGFIGSSGGGAKPFPVAEEEMENILRAIDGVGELRLMLTVDSGTKRELAQDTTTERSGSEDVKRKSETVVVGTGSGTQEVVVTNRVYPRYVGALVVCEGGGSAGVRLAVTQAVSALTALPSDKITVLQGKP